MLFKDKSQCCGCGACKAICPMLCIKMVEDNEGFNYPKIDYQVCIKCGKCETVCPIIQRKKRNKEKKRSFYCAYNLDYQIMQASSSGGIFWLLVKKIIDRQGVVYGAVTKNDFLIQHDRSETLEECQKFRKSKYLQSKTEDIFQQVEQDLKNGKDVLFSGTPCQVAALYVFLGKEYINLFTCEVVCHGVPSQKVFRKYINEINQKLNADIKIFCWRDKRNGWEPNYISLRFKDGRELVTTSRDNPFQKGFLDNLYLRPSCYKCLFAKFPRIADISLADFWGYDQNDLEIENENRGLSLVITNNDKGEKLFNQIDDSIRRKEVSESYAKSKSRHIYLHPIENKNRKNFFNDLENISFERLSKKYIADSVLKKLLAKLKKYL